MGTGPQSCIGGINKDSVCDLVVVREEMTPPSNSLSSYFEMSPLFQGSTWFFFPKSKDEEVWILLLLVNASPTKASARDHWFLSALSLHSSRCSW